MLTFRLFMLQRVTALIMAPLVLGHLAVMVYAIRGGLSTGAILSRTQGSLPWALFYGTFVVAVSIHAAIGVRVIAAEVLHMRGLLLNALAWALCAFSLFSGLRAVLSVTAL
ncbi:succinate dehydrogenase [Bradyrhizobium sp. CCGUVB23]|uniref:succinate dehydrogenase n=1 Tax=Bradyrhizobium sp. CCGUVB23 TaxID=2949630 RepID=UPI0020B2AC7D|nr:succinate dehydrogenase [Bradyrhizobium sp. CCGUVB23]MCP3460988.1 succinate dehydrogenase [Bradyrhizobium sp. CCGUVB23]